jgi:hypothetical protein
VTFHRKTIPGYEKAEVINPWVFADYGQPQRRRGYVSPFAFQSHAPMPRSAYLGETPAAPATVEVDEPLRLMRRMHVLATLSTIFAGVGLLLMIKGRK